MEEETGSLTRMLGSDEVEDGVGYTAMVGMTATPFSYISASSYFWHWCAGVCGLADDDDSTSNVCFIDHMNTISHTATCILMLVPCSESTQRRQNMETV